MGLGAREAAAQPCGREPNIGRLAHFFVVFRDVPIMTKAGGYEACAYMHRYVTVIPPQIRYKHFLEHTAVSKELC